MADLSPNTLDAALAPDRRESPRRPIRAARRPRESVRLLGQRVDLVRPEEVLNQVEAWVAQGRKAVVANHNLNSLNLVRRHPDMADFYRRADLVEVDSAPLIAFARLIGIHGRAFHRCTYLDWRDHFWSLADRKGWRVMYLGGAPGVAETARQRLAARYPGAEIAVRDGYFDAAPGSAGTAEVIAALNAFQPNILFVGMGMPRQEVWIGQTLDALPDSVIFSVGAAFDYEAGVQSVAPRWMGPLGLEWLYRLVRDPGRLARRYLIEPWGLADLILADVVTAIRGRLARG
ncbi:glycosyltransferase [Brevundimonas sp. LM2]|uniref:WecB/TagA/CpsF family glycosyltransferase n=1 Tax=Brevundimonas sp. LM2 TaxID=1938605 RepID=UPI000983D4FB|nr:WecB/TagA/CpsF family glycosyltransferase [Brevundimonas sp. LM2]AQR62921.1 glycosyltransferase [Brevundimonas sp. LM2]